LRRLLPQGRAARLSAASHFPINFNRKNPMTQFARTSILVAAVALTALAGCASTERHESTGQYVDDTTITTKVKAAIFNDPMLKSAEINVETFKGRVQLSGFVSSRASIDRAVSLAQGVSGVTSVANDMRVK
jgi:osmotically-inducible protein OsmY